MGSLTNVPQNFAAFQNQIFPNGLDLGRCTIQQDIGAYYAAPGATFLQGSLVALDTVTQQVVQYTGAGTATFLLGVAKWTKATNIYAAVVDEEIHFPTGAAPRATTLAHPLVSKCTINTLPQGKGTQSVDGTDFTLTAANGLVTTIAGHNLDPTVLATTYYASYTWELSASDLYQFQGLNFWNFNDQVSIQDNRVTVITDWSMLFTSQYNTAMVYTIGQQLYSNNVGQFTTVSDPNVVMAATVGRVFQLPGVNDPFLGVIAGGNPL